MRLLRRYSPPIHLSHRFFYRHGSTPSHVERRKTGPGANPARYYELKAAAHTEPMSSQKQIDARWGRPSACQLLTPASCFLTPAFFLRSEFCRTKPISIERSFYRVLHELQHFRKGPSPDPIRRPIAPVSWLLFSHPIRTACSTYEF